MSKGAVIQTLQIFLKNRLEVFCLIKSFEIAKQTYYFDHMRYIGIFSDHYFQYKILFDFDIK